MARVNLVLRDARATLRKQHYALLELVLEFRVTDPVQRELRHRLLTRTIFRAVHSAADDGDEPFVDGQPL